MASSNAAVVVLSSLTQYNLVIIRGRQATLLTGQEQLAPAATAETLSVAELAHMLSTELGLGSGLVARTIALLDEANTIPFIARYRNAMMRSLTEVRLQ